MAMRNTSSRKRNRCKRYGALRYAPCASKRHGRAVNGLHGQGRVTGGSRGIGRAIAQQFAAHGGARVVATTRTARRLMKRWHRGGGDGHAIYQADIANPEAVSRLVDAVAPPKWRATSTF
ncbi:MAG: SDR family NAD(P)-dependent oxidoreductase [Anaerolineae bacterium]